MTSEGTGARESGSTIPARKRAFHWKRLLRSWWPHWPLAIALAASGALNIMSSLQYHSKVVSAVASLSSLSQPLAVLGTRTQLGLGIGLVLVGIGLLWRLRTAWIFAVILLAVTVGVNVLLPYRGYRGVSLYLPGLMLFALLVFGRHFTRTSKLGDVLIPFAGILATMAFGTFGSYLLGQGFRPPIQDLTAAFYYSVITLSTVGYGDIVPMTTETRMFTVVFLVVGVSIFASAIASTLLPAISGELSQIFNPRSRPVSHKDHVILVGWGAIARNTALELIDRDIPFVQILPADIDAAFPDAEVVRGDPSDDNTLHEADIDRARMVIAAREEDGENAFTSLVAKDLNPGVRVLAVASSARSIRLLRLARADLVFAPSAVGSRLLADLVEGGQISDEFRDLLEEQPRHR